MLKLLLDEHVPPAVATELKRHIRSLEAHPLPQWRGGAFLGESDERIVAEAAALGLTLVTYDVKTIPNVLYGRVRAGLSHGGAILVTSHQIRMGEVGDLVRALESLFRRMGSLDWTNRVVFLRKEER